jgi:transcriptional regulator with XRE-family HTH domain
VAVKMTDPPADYAADRRRLGLRVRELRRLRALTTRELARRVEVSPSMISQVETGSTNASVGTLRRIATALDVPLAEFLVDGSPAQPTARSLAPAPRTGVVRRNRRKRLQLPESHVVYELLTPDLRWDVEFLWIALEPNHPPVESMAHPGQECALVIEGTLHIVIGDEEFVLETGDSIAFDSAVPHRIENRGDVTVIQISAITPPSF